MRREPLNGIHYLGVPFNSDGTPPEVEDPPARLRQAGLVARLSASRPVHDCGDLQIPTAVKQRDPGHGVLNWPSWQAVTGSVAEAVRGILAARGWPLVVGGDCSILVGVMAGAIEVEDRCGLFFVDAHGDLHTPATSPTGEPADMELAALTGRAPCPLSRSAGALLDDADVVVIGVREPDGIDAAPIRTVDSTQLRRGDIVSRVRTAAEALSDRPAWLHLDVDVLDPSLMPVIYPAGAGLTFDETRTTLRVLIRTGRVIGMTVACFHPNLDSTGAATAGLVELLSSVLTD